MVLCRFFLQGNCRFGDMCKFEHQLNDNRQTSTSIIRQQKFPANTDTTNVDSNTLITSVATDMVAAEKGAQWLLSCYAPFKEKPCFPGFEEQSFEEVRWGFYEARVNGTTTQYYHQLHTVMQNAAMQIRLLQNPTPDIINTITSLYYSSNTSSGAATVMPFTNTNMFTQNQQTSSAKSIFATANQQLFGAQTQPPQTNSVFSNNQNIFSNNMNQNQFIMQPQNESYGPFPSTHQNTSPFVVNSQNNTPLFTGETNNQPAIILTQNTPAPMLLPPVTADIPHQSVFNNNIFGGNLQTHNQNKPDQDDSFYSKPDDLSDADVKIFETDTFEFGKIPEKPPTKQMCF